ncbi:UNVERIFIED_CONTAM: hypothetical protein Sindi_1834800 [Sesamum indicum]
MQRPDTPIEVGSEETHPQNLTPRPTRGASCSMEMVGSQAGGDAAGTSRHRKRKHREIADREQSARVDHRTESQRSDELTGAMLAPNWSVSDLSTVLNSEAGQESFELYRNICLPRDQAAILSSPYPRLEQFGAHSLMSKPLCDRCPSNARCSASVTRRSIKNIASSEMRRPRCRTLLKLLGRLRRVSDRAFLLAKRQVVCKTAVEIKAGIYMMQGFNKCKAQANNLNAFAEGFDQSRLNPFVDENFQPYVPELPPEIEGTEFASLLDDVEAMDE